MKNLIKNIKELKKTAKGKAILFFGFYFVFFLVIILIVKFAPKNLLKPEDYESSTPSYFSFGVLNSMNYHFNYSITIDGVNYNYVGDKNSDSEMFEFEGSKYYRNKDDYYKYSNEWAKVDNPYKLNSFMKKDILIKLINSSYYDSNTTYGTGKSTYNLLISSNTINKVVYDKDTDIDDIPGKLIVYVDENKNIEKIEMNLDNYCSNSDICNNALKLVFEYSKYGEIEEIKYPFES